MVLMGVQIAVLDNANNDNPGSANGGYIFFIRFKIKHQ